MAPPPAQHVFQPPTGTRDFYPPEMLRRRYLEKAWRDTAIRHGFEEIDGPTFEHLDLYTVKSGEGIVSELFSFERAGGEKTYALRPEFTPTLARMYADRANSLAKPTKWFWQQNCFRAERPQRGRLREFFQWNVDYMGGEATPDSKALVDAEVIACCIDGLRSLGVPADTLKVRISHREALFDLLSAADIRDDALRSRTIGLIDAMPKLSDGEQQDMAEKIGLAAGEWRFVRAALNSLFELDSGDFTYRSSGPTTRNINEIKWENAFTDLRLLFDALRAAGVVEWCELDLRVARGLAYYTGMVFEVHEASGAERAIAGGGRYDKLIEMFGGPPTPAVGFGMGDVVLSLVLQDRGLMPEGRELLDKLSEPGASLRPDAFVISNGSDEAERALRPTVAALRRAGLHARHTYKATKNIGKILKDAAGVHARFAVILEPAAGGAGAVSPDAPPVHAILKDLDRNQQHPEPVALAGLAARLFAEVGR